MKRAISPHGDVSNERTTVHLMETWLFRLATPTLVLLTAFGLFPVRQALTAFAISFALVAAIALVIRADHLAARCVEKGLVFINLCFLIPQVALAFRKLHYRGLEPYWLFWLLFGLIGIVLNIRIIRNIWRSRGQNPPSGR